MFRPRYTNQFKKDVHKLHKSGRYDIEKLKDVISKLLNGESLECRYKDHPLSGNKKGLRDCHIEPDRILIYRIDRKTQTITFIRTGSHSELFG